LNFSLSNHLALIYVWTKDTLIQEEIKRLQCGLLNLDKGSKSTFLPNNATDVHLRLSRGVNEGNLLDGDFIICTGLFTSNINERERERTVEARLISETCQPNVSHKLSRAATLEETVRSLTESLARRVYYYSQEPSHLYFDFRPPAFSKYTTTRIRSSAYTLGKTITTWAAITAYQIVCRERKASIEMRVSKR
jgi:hypothetical protein